MFGIITDHILCNPYSGSKDMAKNRKSIGEIRKKVTTTYELISTAHHEASHAVFAFLHFMPASLVSIYENKQFKRIDGLTIWGYSDDFSHIKDSDLLKRLIKAEIGILYAGLIAEKILFKQISGCDQVPFFIKQGSSDDNKAAAKLVKDHNLAPAGRKRWDYKQKICREVATELNDNWDAVSVIAHALFKNRRLDYKEMQELLTKKTKDKKFWRARFKQINSFFDNINSLDENFLMIILGD
jgi:hypothetical protein